MICALLILGLLLLLLPAASSAEVKSNVPYGSNEKQVMDIYPAPTANAPLIVMVHSGGWKSGDKLTTHTRAEALQKAGFAVFNTNYRLDSATVLAFPMQVEDIEAATRFAITEAGKYNANPINVILIGGSAGGHLVGATIERMNKAAPGTIRGVIALSGLFDLPKMMKDYKEGKLAGTLLKDVTQALGCAKLQFCEIPEKQALAEQWSPALQPTTPCAPWLIYNSTEEVVPLDQPNAMTAWLQEKACKVAENLVAGKLHAYGYWKQVQEQIFAFIREN